MATSGPELEREVGLFEATVYGVGLILGAGIYAIIGEAAGVAGGSLIPAFLLAATIASLTGLSYAELASRYPVAEGDYVYARRAFHSEHLAEATALGRLLMGVIAAAAVALAFGGYLSVFVPVSPVVAAIALIALMSAINFWGIDFSTRVNVAFTAAEVAGLLVVVWVGRGTWGSVDLLEAPLGAVGVAEAVFLVFFAYLGFGSIVNVAEETRDATRTIPRAIVLSIGITSVLYVLVGLSAVGLVDWRALGASESPLALVASAGWGEGGGLLVALIALVSTANTVLILLISTSRLLYGVSKTEYRAFPVVLSRVHPERRTPYLAVAVAGVAALPFVLLRDVGTVAGLTNVVLLLVFAVVNAALLRLRYAEPDHDGFTAPLSVGRLSLTALGGLLTSVALVVVYVAGWL
ncbi:MAG TPA: amino acid permease [Halobacteriales archaeon]|nr:amino acid permease [Halobacteriales archaeon]